MQALVAGRLWFVEFVMLIMHQFRDFAMFINCVFEYLCLGFVYPKIGTSSSWLCLIHVSILHPHNTQICSEWLYPTAKTEDWNTISAETMALNGKLRSADATYQEMRSTLHKVETDLRNTQH